MRNSTIIKVYGLLLILCLMSTVSFAQTEQKINVVFDLDWTLFYQIKPEQKQIYSASEQNNFIIYNNLFYRVTPNALQAIQSLHQDPRFTVSYMSGGDRERNLFLINWLYSQAELKNYKPFKILNLDNLQVVSNDSSKKFTDRYKKKLSPYFDLKSTILIDDSKDFSAPSEEMNMLWLGPTYLFLPEYSNSTLQSFVQTDIHNKAYLPACKAEWSREENKILTAVLRIKESVNKYKNLFLQHLKDTENIQINNQCTN